jgi:hypothetical protein
MYYFLSQPLMWKLFCIISQKIAVYDTEQILKYSSICIGVKAQKVHDETRVSALVL